MLQLDKVRSALRPQTGESHLLKLSDVMHTLGMVRDDCIAVLDALVEQGELRRTFDANGETYYWFVNADKEPGAGK